MPSRGEAEKEHYSSFKTIQDNSYMKEENNHKVFMMSTFFMIFDVNK